MPNYTNISITHLQTFEEIKRVIAVRHQVFVLEQGYSVEAESDNLDDISQHWIATCDKENEDGTKELNIDVGVVRLIPKSAGVAKLGRLAVLSSVRGLYIGRKLTNVLIDYCRKNGFHTIVLHAQYPKRGFYEKCGFSIEAGDHEIFNEAGTPHVRMWMRNIC